MSGVGLRSVSKSFTAEGARENYFTAEDAEENSKNVS
jgi:hypothetical protein